MTEITSRCRDACVPPRAASHGAGFLAAKRVIVDGRGWRIEQGFDSRGALRLERRHYLHTVQEFDQSRHEWQPRRDGALGGVSGDERAEEALDQRPPGV